MKNPKSQKNIKDDFFIQAELPVVLSLQLRAIKLPENKQEELDKRVASQQKRRDALCDYLLSQRDQNIEALKLDILNAPLKENKHPVLKPKFLQTSQSQKEEQARYDATLKVLQEEQQRLANFDARCIQSQESHLTEMECSQKLLDDFHKAREVNTHDNKGNGR